LTQSKTAFRALSRLKCPNFRACAHGDLATEEAQRVILNGSITTHAAAFGGFIADIGAAANLQDPTNATCFQSDGAYLQGAGYDVAVPIVKDQVVAALA
jgi:hypothetical protein